MFRKRSQVDLAIQLLEAGFVAIRPHLASMVCRRQPRKSVQLLVGVLVCSIVIGQNCFTSFSDARLSSRQTLRLIPLRDSRTLERTHTAVAAENQEQDGPPEGWVMRSGSEYQPDTAFNRYLTGDEIMWQAATRINIRVQPDVRSVTLAQADVTLANAGKTRPNKDKGFPTIEEGDFFEVENIMRDPSGQVYLKLFGQDGWVFTKGVAGEWWGRDIVVPVEESRVQFCRLQVQVMSARRRFEEWTADSAKRIEDAKPK